MNKESACIMMCIVSNNFSKTLDLKREIDVILWRHKQRTSSNNDHRTPPTCSHQWPSLAVLPTGIQGVSQLLKQSDWAQIQDFKWYHNDDYIYWKVKR